MSELLKILDELVDEHKIFANRPGSGTYHEERLKMYKYWRELFQEAEEVSNENNP